MTIKVGITTVLRYEVAEDGKFVAITLGTMDGGVPLVLAMDGTTLDGFIQAAMDAKAALEAAAKPGESPRVFCRPITGYQIAPALERRGFVIAQFGVAEGVKPAFLLPAAVARDIGKKLIARAQEASSARAEAGELVRN